MFMRPFTLLSGALGIVLGCASIQAEGLVEFETERVIVFKDGHAMVIRKGVGMTDDSGMIQTADVPDEAALGSFWAAPEAGRLVGMRAGWEEIESNAGTEQLARNSFEALSANKGRQCELQLSDDRRLNGVIRETIAGDDRVGGSIGGSLVISASGIDHFIPIAQVRSFSIPDMQVRFRWDAPVKSREKRLTFRFEKANAKREITLIYFRSGIRWIPTYRVDLPTGAGKEARMELQAELLNDAEDLIDVPIDIVVGVPNFRFKETRSPLTLEAVMRNVAVQGAGGAWDPALQSQVIAGGLLNSIQSHRPGAVAQASEKVRLPSELTASATQELFLYHLPKITLRKGDRAAMKVAEMVAPVRDVYTWDLHLARHDNATAPSGKGASPLKLSENRIWRQIELVNDSGVPWTTGPVMVMLGDQPMAQELLTYTSVGNRCRIPVTVAIDVIGTVDGTELERKLSALHWDHQHYALIRNQTKVELGNNKSIPIDLELTAKLGGRVLEASNEGRVKLLPFDASDWIHYRSSPAVNNSSVVVWKTRVAPGATFRPSMKHEFYARH